MISIRNYLHPIYNSSQFALLLVNKSPQELNYYHHYYVTIAFSPFRFHRWMTRNWVDADTSPDTDPHRRPDKNRTMRDWDALRGHSLPVLYKTDRRDRVNNFSMNLIIIIIAITFRYVFPPNWNRPTTEVVVVVVSANARENVIDPLSMCKVPYFISTRLFSRWWIINSSSSDYYHQVPFAVSFSVGIGKWYQTWSTQVRVMCMSNHA